MPNKITFHCVVKFAQFCAELQRQNIAFRGEEFGNVYTVSLTGY